MTLKSDATFEEKLTCGLKYDMRNLANLYQTSQKTRNLDFDGFFLPKAESVEFKIYRGVVRLRGIDLLFQN